MTTFSEQ